MLRSVGRIAAGEFWEGLDPEAEADTKREVEDGYAAPQTQAALTRLLVFLDAMPERVILADRFYVRRKGAMCALAAFCASAGASRVELREIDSQGRAERAFLGNDGYEEAGGEEGASVWAAVAWGLPPAVAVDLLWRNESLWKESTPGERWALLRAHVVKRIGGEP